MRWGNRALGQERDEQSPAFVLTHARTVVTGQLEARLALAGERAGRVDAAVLAVAVPALIDVWKKERKGNHSLVKILSMHKKPTVGSQYPQGSVASGRKPQSLILSYYIIASGSL